MSANEIAQSFIQQYYTALATNPTDIAQFYAPQSTMSFEGQGPFTGPQEIVKKFVEVGQVGRPSQKPVGPKSQALGGFLTDSCAVDYA